MIIFEVCWVIFSRYLDDLSLVLHFLMVDLLWFLRSSWIASPLAGYQVGTLDLSAGISSEGDRSGWSVLVPTSTGLFVLYFPYPP